MFALMMLYLALLIIRPQDYPAMAEATPLPLQQGVLLLAAGAWLLAERKRLESPQHALLSVFCLVLMLSSIAAGWMGGALLQLEKFGPTLLAFVIMAACLDRPSRIRGAMATLALCALVPAIHGIEQSRLGTGWTGIGLSQGTRIQYVGIFNDPNDLGMLFATCLPMSLYLSGRGGLLGFRRLWWWLVSGVLLYGIVLTDSRGTMLGLLATFAVYAWQRHGALKAGLASAFGIGVLLMMPSRMQEGVTEASAMGRVDSWYEGLQMFQSSPLLGIGPDRYSDINNLTAHNSLVLVLAETGIVGFALWFAFVAYCFRMMMAGVNGSQSMSGEAFLGAMQATPAAAGPIGVDEPLLQALSSHHEDRVIALALLLSLTAFFSCAFFLSRSYIVTLYLLAAMAVAHYGNMRRHAPDLPEFRIGRDVLWWPVAIVAVVAGLYVLVKILLATA